MSTTITPAYRLKKSDDLWPLAEEIRTRGRANVRATLRAFYEQLASGVRTDSDVYREALKASGHEPLARMGVATQVAKDAYREQLGSPYRNEFNFDVKVSVYELRGRIYLRPFCDLTVARVLDFLKEDPRLEGYAYWNGSDSQLEYLTRRQWDARERTWDAIFKGCYARRQLELDVCSWDSFYWCNPADDLMRELWAQLKDGAK